MLQNTDHESGIHYSSDSHDGTHSRNTHAKLIIALPPITHTFGHIDCPACEETRKEAMGFDPDSLRSMSFELAGQKWIEVKRRYLKPRTAYLNSRHLVHLNKFFGEIVVDKIHLGHLRQYQERRAINACKHGISEGKGCTETECTQALWTKKCGPSIINHELSVVQQILKHAGVWERFGDLYQALRTPSWRPPKTMSDEEEIRLFTIASRNPDWALAYWVASISNNTTATGTELRNMLIEHVQLDGKIPIIKITGEHLKNDIARPRVIALNDTAVKMFRLCLERAAKLGSGKPEHYVFPFRINRAKWDPLRAASESWLRRSFAALREAADLPWLTPHCLRHQCITLMYEMELDDETIRHTSGHTSMRMSRWYSHNRRKKQKAALDSIDPSRRFGPQSATSDHYGQKRCTR